MALLSLCRLLLSTSLPALLTTPALAMECEGESCVDDDVNLVQLTHLVNKQVRALAQQVDDEEEISNLLQNTAQAEKGKEKGKAKEETNPEPESAVAPSDEEDFFVGQWHDDHFDILTITRENASWYKIVTDDPNDAEGGTSFAFRVNSTHIEMDDSELIFQGEMQEGNHHLHWHRGFGHEEWQKVGFEQEDTRWMHHSQYDAEHPLVDYEVTPEDMMHVTEEEFRSMEENHQSIASLAEHDIEEHLAQHDGSVPPLVPLHQPHYWSPEDDLPSNDSHGAGQPGPSSSLFRKAAEGSELRVAFAQTEAAERLREAFEAMRAVSGDEQMEKGYEKIVAAMERRAHFDDSDIASAKGGDPNRVIQALEVLSSKLGRNIGHMMATKMTAMMLQKVGEAKAMMEKGGA